MPWSAIDFSKHLGCGAATYVLSKIIVAPFQRVGHQFLQMQANSTPRTAGQRFKGLVDVLVRIPKEQGFLSLWRVSLAEFFITCPMEALSFTFTEVFLSGVDKRTQFWRYFAGNLASGGAAGATGLCFVFPLAATLFRLDAAIDSGKARQFTSLGNCIATIAKQEGVRGLYQGFFLSVQRVVLYRAAYFGTYDTVKGMLADPQGTPIVVSWFIAQTVAAGAGVISNHFIVVATRMMKQSLRPQEEPMYKGTIDCWRKIYANEGGNAFFKGAFSRILRTAGSALAIVLYDELKTIYFGTSIRN